MVHKTRDPFERYEKDMKKHSTMSLVEAKEILGDRADLELRNMKKALESFPLLNTSEENRRLVAVKKVLRSK